MEEKTENRTERILKYASIFSLFLIGCIALIFSLGTVALFSLSAIGWGPSEGLLIMFLISFGIISFFSIFLFSFIKQLVKFLYILNISFYFIMVLLFVFKTEYSISFIKGGLFFLGVR